MLYFLQHLFKHLGNNSVLNGKGENMKNHSILILPLILILNSFCFSQDQKTNQEYQNILKEIENIQPVSVAEVPDSGLGIQQDAAIFKLIDGELFKCNQIAGAERLLLFKGKEQFSFSPSSQIEKDHLYRFYEKQSLDEEFYYLVIMFSDPAKLRLLGDLKFSEKSDLSDIKRDFQKFIDYTYDSDAGYFDTDLMRSFLNNHTNELFYAHIGLTNGDPVFFKISPYDREEVSFLKKKDTKFMISSDYQEVISSYSLPKPYEKDKSFKEDVIKINNYNIISKIEDNLDFSAKCEINYERKYTNSNWITFSLYYELIVDSVLLNDERTFDYYRGEENYELWIKLNPLSTDNKITSLLQGDLMEKDELSWISIKSPDYWFPRYSYRDNVLHDLTFTYPEKYKLVSIGKKESEVESDDFITCRWKSVEPAHSASFNIGFFEKFELEDESKTKVNVFISKSGHQKLANLLASYGTLSGGDMDEKIATDVLASIQFFKGTYRTNST